MNTLKINEYKKLFYDSKTDKIRIVESILKESSYEEIIRFHVNTPTTFKGIYKRVLKYLQRDNYASVYGSGLYSMMSPVDYLGWATFVVTLFKNEVNRFVKLQEEFESAYLNSDYTRCLDVIDSCNKNISYSYWAASNSIRIADLVSGLDRRVELYNSIAEGASPAMDTMCSIAQEMASISTTSSTIIEDLHHRISTTFKQKWEVSFLTAHCFPFKHEPLGEWVSFDMTSSIIDIYVFLMINIHKYVSVYRDDERVIKYINELCASIHDNRLFRYQALLCGNDIKLDQTRINAIANMNKAYNIQTEEDAVSYINLHPTDFDFAFEYFQYIIRNDRSPKYRVDGECLHHVLLNHLYNILLCHDTQFHQYSIYQICHTNPSLMPFRHLYEITQYVEQNSYNKEYRYIWHYSYDLNYYDSLYYTEEDSRLEFLNKIGFNTLNSDVDFFKLLVCRSNIYKETDTIRLAFKNDCLPDFQKRAVAQYLFDYFFAENFIKDAINLFLNSWFSAQQIEIKVDSQAIERMLTHELELKLDMPLELSVFYSIINASIPKIQANLLNTLVKYNVWLPSEINIIDNRYLLYFLEKVTDRNMLELCPMLFDSEDEVIEERLRICRNLRNYREKKEYIIEINALIKEQEILKFLKVVDSSKIYVDESNIKKYELQQAKDLFDIIVDTDRQIEILLPTLDNDKAKIETQKNEEVKRIKIKYRFILFTRFYLYVRDQFLLNEHAGLDYFLSSRVRHGTIVNQLRHHLQEYRFTTLKNSLGQYDVNDYWASERLHLIGEDWVRCTEFFMKFTENVDALIIRLKDHYVQVRTEAHKNNLIDACFDYSEDVLKQDIVNLYNIDNISFDYTIDCIFSDLWNHTEHCFDKIKKAVRDTELMLKAEMDTLYDNVSKLKGLHKTEEKLFRDSINHCKQSLTSDIEDVLSWFQRRPTSEYDFKFNQLIDASKEGINKINDISFNIKENVKTERKYSGSVLNVFYDLFHNIFCNIVDYSIKKEIDAECNLLVEEEEDYLHINVSNLIYEEDISSAQACIDDYMTKRQEIDRAVSSRDEGNSGMLKNDNIVYYQLRGENNRYMPMIENSQYIVDIKILLKNIIVS